MRCLLLVAAAAAVSPVTALTCKNLETGTDESCTGTNDDGLTLTDVCIYVWDAPKDKDTGAIGNPISSGCLPEPYLSSLITTDSGCAAESCWCMTDNCNTADWAAQSIQDYVVPPMCYGGIAGGNLGETCTESALYTTKKVEYVSCEVRVYEGCRENNDEGMGDGCNDDPAATKSSCEATRPDEKRNVDESFDGTTNHCYWASTIADKESACEVDDKCTWTSATSSCTTSTVQNDRTDTWNLQKGMECEKRLYSGCYIEEKDGNNVSVYEEGDEWDGEKCFDITTESACNAKTEPAPCPTDHLGDPACRQCTWIPPPVDEAAAENQCYTKQAGTLDGICEYSDGNGTPPKSIAEAGYEYIFRKGPEFIGRCSLIASFRKGYGSGIVLGGDTQGLVEQECKYTGLWEALAEHIGHDKTTIDEYCTNFIPDSSVMDGALKTYSSREMIAGVKAGKFDTIFPSLTNQRFLVTARAGFGECLFTANADQWGVAICTCREEGCNNQTALELIIDPVEGPMRLIQFIDGSLSEYKTDINAIVPGLLDGDGIFDPEVANSVTEEHVDQMLAIAAIAELTNKEELWGVIMDYQNLNSFIALGGDPNDPPPAVLVVMAEDLGDPVTAEAPSLSIGAIIGIAVGGVVFVGVVVALSVVLYKRSNARKVQATKDGEEKPAAGRSDGDVPP